MKTRLKDICFILLITLAFAAPLLHPFNFQGQETALKSVQRLAQLDFNVRNGYLPPRWAFDFARGLGTAFFNFYPPLFLYVAELFHIAGMSFPVSVDASSFLLALLGSTGAYLAVSAFLGRYAGILGSAIYAMMPYRIMQLYVRGAYAEFSAGAVLPWCVFSLKQFLDKKSAIWGVFTGFTVFCLLIAHNAIAILFLPILGVWVLYECLPGRQIKTLFSTAGWMCSGVLAGSYYWVPALLEKNLVKVDLMNRGYFSIGVHFPTIHQLLGNQWGFGPSVAGPDDKLPMQLGSIVAVIFIAVIFYCVHMGRVQQRQLRFWLLISGIIILMNLPVSLALWKACPLITFLQFPWRSLIIWSITAVLSLCYIFAVGEHSTWRTLLFLLILPGIIVSFRYVRAPSFHNIENINVRPEVIRESWITTTASGEYVPRSVPDKLMLPFKDIQIETGHGQVNDVKLTDGKYVIKIHTDTQTLIRIARSYYPGWTILDNNHKIAGKSGIQGMLTFNLDPGDHTLIIKWQETALRTLFNVLSLITFFIYIVVIINETRRQAKIFFVKRIV